MGGLLDSFCDWSHPEGHIEPYCLCWAVHHACSAVPALIRISYHWSVVAFSEAVSWAYLDAFEAADAVIVEYGWHLGDLLWRVQYLNGFRSE